MMWRAEKLRQLGRAKLIDLEVVIAPHTKEPNEAIGSLRERLHALTERDA